MGGTLDGTRGLGCATAMNAQIGHHPGAVDLAHKALVQQDLQFAAHRLARLACNARRSKFSNTSAAVSAGKAGLDGEEGTTIRASFGVNELSGTATQNGGRRRRLIGPVVNPGQTGTD